MFNRPRYLLYVVKEKKQKMDAEYVYNVCSSLLRGNKNVHWLFMLFVPLHYIRYALLMQPKYQVYALFLHQIIVVIVITKKPFLYLLGTTWYSYLFTYVEYVFTNNKKRETSFHTNQWSTLNWRFCKYFIMLIFINIQSFKKELKFYYLNNENISF